MADHMFQTTKGKHRFHIHWLLQDYKKGGYRVDEEEFCICLTNLKTYNINYAQCLAQHYFKNPQFKSQPYDHTNTIHWLIHGSHKEYELLIEFPASLAIPASLAFKSRGSRRFRADLRDDGDAEVGGLRGLKVNAGVFTRAVALTSLLQHHWKQK